MDIDVSDSKIDEDGSFYLPHAPDTGQLVTVDEQGRHPEINLKSFDSLLLRTRERTCQDCADKQDKAGEALAASRNEDERSARFKPCGDCGTLLELYRHEYCSASRQQRRRVLIQRTGSKQLSCKACTQRGGLGDVELRIDPIDGQRYTQQQFVDEYGGTQEWEAAYPADVASLRNRPIRRFRRQRQRKCCTCQRLLPKDQTYSFQKPRPHFPYRPLITSWVCQDCAEYCSQCETAIDQDQADYGGKCFHCNTNYK